VASSIFPALPLRSRSQVAPAGSRRAIAAASPSRHALYSASTQGAAQMLATSHPPHDMVRAFAPMILKTSDSPSPTSRRQVETTFKTEWLQGQTGYCLNCMVTMRGNPLPRRKRSARTGRSSGRHHGRAGSPSFQEHLRGIQHFLLVYDLSLLSPLSPVSYLVSLFSLSYVSALLSPLSASSSASSSSFTHHHKGIVGSDERDERPPAEHFTRCVVERIGSDSTRPSPGVSSLRYGGVIR